MKMGERQKMEIKVTGKQGQKREERMIGEKRLIRGKRKEKEEQ